MNQPLSPFRRGADNGFLFGLYLSVLYLLMIFSSSVPLLNIPVLGMMVAVPALIYFMLRRDRLAPQGGVTIVGALWIDGLLTFLCGGLIGSLVVFIYMRWIDPDFIVSNIEQSISLLEAAGDADSIELADEFRSAMSNGFNVSPIVFAMTLLWMVTFSGSILSLILSAVIARKHSAPGQANTF